MFKVIEVFNSIEGEGLRQGLPVTFVRFAGCNLHCKWCDTQYANNPDKLEYGENGGEYTAESLTALIEDMCLSTRNRITFTGGEPLANKERFNFIVLFAQTHEKFDINIETNGSINPERLYSQENVTITMDYKCASADSGCKQNYWYTLRNKDCLKVVIGNVSDINETTKLLRKLRDSKRVPSVYLHQVYGEFDLAELADFVMHSMDIYPNTRVGYQLHKLIWDPEQRGV